MKEQTEEDDDSLFETPEEPRPRTSFRINVPEAMRADKVDQNAPKRSHVIHAQPLTFLTSSPTWTIALIGSGIALVVLFFLAWFFRWVYLRTRRRKGGLATVLDGPKRSPPTARSTLLRQPKKSSPPLRATPNTTRPISSYTGIRVQPSPALGHALFSTASEVLSSSQVDQTPSTDDLAGPTAGTDHFTLYHPATLPTISSASAPPLPQGHTHEPVNEPVQDAMHHVVPSRQRQVTPRVRSCLGLQVNQPSSNSQRLARPASCLALCIE